MSPQNDNRNAVGQKAQQLRAQVKLQSINRAMRDMQEERSESDVAQEEQFLRLLRDGVADEIRSAIIEARREIEQHRKLGRLSTQSDETATAFESKAVVFLKQKELLEKLEENLDLLKAQQKTENTDQCKTDIEEFTQRAVEQRKTCVALAEEVLKLRRRFDNQVRQDRRAVSGLMQTFHTCLEHLPPANRGKLEVQIREKIKSVDVTTQIKILNAIINKLAMSIPSIAITQVDNLYDAARLSFREKKFKQALTELDQLFKFNKLHIDAHRLRAQIFHHVHNTIAYNMELRMIAKIPEAGARDFYALAQALESTTLEEAYEFYLKTAELDSRLKYVEKLGEVAYRLRRWAQALNAFDRIVAKKPNRAKTLHKLGHCYFETHVDEKALDSLRAAIHLKDDCSTSHVILGRIYRNRRMLEQAESCFRCAVDLDSHDPESRYWLALLLYDAGETNEALIFAQLAFDMEPVRVRNRILLAKCIADSGNHENALAMLDESLEAGSPSLDLLLAYSDICRLAGQVSKAVDVFEPVLKRFPRHPQLRAEFGLLLLDSGRFKEAAPYLNPTGTIKAA
ncbi:MAG: CDC27 family protein [Candidatus Hinthialibacter antarcticus]|nr:CDC27 family protein [Candidatus Hinthialibacter antarcticus]